MVSSKKQISKIQDCSTSTQQAGLIDMYECRDSHVFEQFSSEDLIVMLKDNQEALVNLKFQKALQQLDHPLQISHLKKEIAQINTLLREFELGIRGK